MHGGGYDGMYSQVMLVPEEDLGIVVLTNSMTGIPSAISYSIADMYLSEEPIDQTKWSDSGLESFLDGRRSFDARIAKAVTVQDSGRHFKRPNSEYVGIYRCPMYGDAVVEKINNSLVLKLLPARTLIADLSHLHYDTFRVNWREDSAWFGSGTAHFVQDAKGRFVKLDLDIPNDDLWFHELKFERTE